MNNNLIPSLLIASALCYVGFNLNRQTEAHSVVAELVHFCDGNGWCQ